MPNIKIYIYIYIIEVYFEKANLKSSIEGKKKLFSQYTGRDEPKLRWGRIRPPCINLIKKWFAFKNLFKRLEKYLLILV